MTEKIIFKKFLIIQKRVLNHDVFSIKVKPIDGILGEVPVSSFFYIKNDEECKRPYTPVLVENGTIKFVIKIYENGKLSNFLNEKRVGDIIDVSNVQMKLKYEKGKEKILMIAGGTGITPMLQIIQSAKANNEKTIFKVIFCNKTKNDIFLEEEIKKYSIDIIHVLEKTDGGDYKGFITEEIIKKNLDGVDFIYVCGPYMMVKNVCGNKTQKDQGEIEGMLKNIGIKKDMVYKF
ncbi:NADH-cytochrome b5 reductase [Spraguea lophii 42_110]|uniref:NADH-cytochrome b5 reductase n=1 Tax=Spraguea lophii (strain 42_110) TaxID=1358809 RepID=S7WAB2_SPRLO|nr:NADH-cytochrome b5 reductase [Spraguea lophii 42_110]